MAKPTGSLLRGVGGIIKDVIPESPKLPAPPPKPISKTNAEVEVARKTARETELRRKGRSSTIISGGRGVVAPTPLSRPQALGS